MLCGIPHKETGTSIRLSRRFQLVIFVTLLLTHILLGIGVGVKCFNFEFLGLGGLILGDDRLKSYSLLSLGSSISQSVENSSSFGIRWIQVRCFCIFLEQSRYALNPTITPQILSLIMPHFNCCLSSLLLMYPTS